MPLTNILVGDCTLVLTMLLQILNLVRINIDMVVYILYQVVNYFVQIVFIIFTWKLNMCV